MGRSSSDVEGKDDLWAYRQGMAWTLLIFMAPALTIPLADPLMSLVDTVVVGQCCGTLELAALGPPNLIFAFANYMWTSQGVTTTSLVADAFNQEGVTRQQAAETAERAMSSSAIISVAAGVAVCGALQVFGPALVALTGAAPELAATGLEYLRIRALATPAVFGALCLPRPSFLSATLLFSYLLSVCSVKIPGG